MRDGEGTSLLSAVCLEDDIGITYFLFFSGQYLVMIEIKDFPAYLLFRYYVGIFFCDVICRKYCIIHSRTFRLLCQKFKVSTRLPARPNYY